MILWFKPFVQHRDADSCDFEVSLDDGNVSLASNLICVRFSWHRRNIVHINFRFFYLSCLSCYACNFFRHGQVRRDDLVQTSKSMPRTRFVVQVNWASSLLLSRGNWFFNLFWLLLVGLESSRKRKVGWLDYFNYFSATRRLYFLRSRWPLRLWQGFHLIILLQQK